MPGRQKQSAPADRTLPHNLEAERSILGAILLHNAAYEKVSERLGPEDFFRDAHRRIYDAVERLLEWPGGMVDLVTLKETLNKRGELEEVGGPAYITALTDGVPRGSNIVHYADVVKEKALLRGLIYAAGKMLERAYQAEEPPHVLLAEADKLIIDLQAGRGAGKMAPLSASASALFENLEYRVQHRGELSGVDTGFKSINEQTQGWQAGDYIVLGARPSIGKTTFAINTMVAGARAGARVACFSMEMTRQQLEYRILASMAAVPLTQLLAGYVPSDDAWGQLSRATSEMADLAIEIDDAAARTVGDIRGACRRMKADGGLDLIVIDYVQLMPGTLERRGATRNEEITDISRRLKVMANEIGIAVILLSQLSRSGDGRSDPRPKLSDLRDSGALEQDADLVCFLHRKNHREGGVTNFILEKQRNGPTGTVNLTLDRDITLFTDGGDEPPAPEPTEDEKRERKTKAILKRRARG